MGTHCLVRTLDPADAVTLAALRREALEAHPLAFSASITDDRVSVEFLRTSLATTEESAVLGAFVGGSLVGMVGVVRNKGAKERHKSFVWGMYVRSEHRRSGAGEQLLLGAIRHARSWPGVGQVHLSVSEAAPDARRLYERHGFREWGREPRALCWDGRCVDETHMLLDL